MNDAVLAGGVTTEVAHGIGTITFFHPLSNSLPGLVLAALADAVRAAGSNPEVRVVVLQSAGEKVFCGGASFDELSTIADAATGDRFFMGFANVINALRTCPKLVVGRIQGKAVGGGVGLASSVDYCLAHSSAAVKLSELAVGIGPFVVGPAVERKVGLSGMSQLAIDATRFRSAEWAEKHGLYAEVFDTHTELDAAVAELAQRLAASSPEAMADLKRVLWQGTEHWDELLPERAAISGRLVLSDFTKNAIAAFKSKG
jgi:methylglutaconyl-CoA hydratase